MINKLHKYFIVLPASIIGVFAFLAINQGVVNAAYSGENIVDNSVFLDSRSMSIPEIQSFLASKNSGLANRSFILNCYASDSKERQWYTSVGAPCDQSVLASGIIYYAAQIYGINPQVILSTLQKEQSLITTPNPTDWQINQAMGYGCPTTGGCGASTFFYQIDNGVWVLRYHYERAQGNMTWWSPSNTWTCGTEKNFYKPNLYPGQNVRFYDEDGVMYRSHFVENAATSSLYCYTPHAYNNPQGLYGRPPFGTVGRYYSGSYNFVNYFEIWFGTTRGSYLLRSAENSTVYLVDGSNKYPISSLDIFGALYPLGSVKYVTQNYLNGLATGNTVGRLLRGTDGTIYFFDAGIRLAFPSCDSLAHYGFGAGCDVGYLNVSNTILEELVHGPNMSRFYWTTNGKKFYIENSTKREVFDEDSLASVGLNGPINVLNESGISNLAYGQPVIRDIVTVTSRYSTQGYYYESGKFYPIAHDLIKTKAFSALPTGNMDPASIQNSQIQPPLTGFVADLSGTQHYLLVNGGKANITDPDVWQPKYTQLSEAFLNSIPNDTMPINNLIISSANNRTVYYVNNKQKRPIPSWDDLVNLKITPFSINYLADSVVDSIATGPMAYAPGRLVKLNNSATVYMIKDTSNLYSISNYLFPKELGLSLNTAIISQNDFHSYSVGSGLGSFVSCGGRFFVGSEGNIYEISPPNIPEYGLNSAYFMDGGDICSNLPYANAVQLSKFIRVNNGTIYLVESGQKHPIMSYVAYIAMGGGQNNTRPVSDYFAGVISTGANIYQ